jgi:hypothetical protein
MPCLVLCPKCQQEYEVDRDAIFLGTWRLGCPRCTTPPPPVDEAPGAEQDGEAGMLR